MLFFFLIIYRKKVTYKKVLTFEKIDVKIRNVPSKKTVKKQSKKTFEKNFKIFLKKC